MKFEAEYMQLTSASNVVLCRLCGSCAWAVLLLICAGHPAQGAGGSKKGGGGKGREEVAKEGESEVHRPLEGGSGMGEDSQEEEKRRRGSLAWPRCSGSSLAKEALQHCMADLHCWPSCCCWFQPAALSGDKEQRQETRGMKEAGSCLLPPSNIKWPQDFSLGTLWSVTDPRKLLKWAKSFYLKQKKLHQTNVTIGTVKP